MFFKIIFYIFSTLTVVGALLVVLSKNPVNSVIAKVFTFLSASGIWVTLQQNYLALMLILIYVGAVLIMFLFVVMMVDTKPFFEKKNSIYSFIIITLFIFLIFLISSILTKSFSEKTLISTEINAKEVGKLMFSNRYLYSFELVSIVLLIAIVSTITLTFRGKKSINKSKDPSKQIQVTSNERLTMINIKPEEN